MPYHTNPNDSRDLTDAELEALYPAITGELPPGNIWPTGRLP